MGKYYDRLVKMNESLDAELHARGIDVSTANRVDNTNNASKNGENEVVLEEDNNTDTIEIPKDSLTDEQKKEILVDDKGVDKETVDGMKDTKEIDAALAASLNTDDAKVKTDESGSGEVVIHMDDPDLEMIGYVKDMSRHGIDLVEDEYDAKTFPSQKDAEDEISKICNRNGYDPNTFEVVPLSSDEKDNEVNIDDGEAWVSLDPMNPQATTINT